MTAGGPEWGFPGDGISHGKTKASSFQQSHQVTVVAGISSHCCCESDSAQENVPSASCLWLEQLKKECKKLCVDVLFKTNVPATPVFKCIMPHLYINYHILLYYRITMCILIYIYIYDRCHLVHAHHRRLLSPWQWPLSLGSCDTPVIGFTRTRDGS